MPLPVIYIERDIFIDGCYKQVQVAVSGYIGKNRSGWIMSFMGNARGFGDILELHDPEVFVEPVALL